jgi:hypothetical protein
LSADFVLVLAAWCFLCPRPRATLSMDLVGRRDLVWRNHGRMGSVLAGLSVAWCFKHVQGITTILGITIRVGFVGYYS